MPTSTGKSYETNWRGQPPHLLEVDVPVWYEFLNHHAPDVVKLYYDVYVGGHDFTPEQLKDPFQRMWYRNTAKRIDAVIETENEVWLIEVATYLAIRAIGQAMSYQVLWSQDPKIDKIERPVLVGKYMDADLLGVAGKLGIRVFLV